MQPQINLHEQIALAEQTIQTILQQINTVFLDHLTRIEDKDKLYLWNEPDNAFKNSFTKNFIRQRLNGIIRHMESINFHDKISQLDANQLKNYFSELKHVKNRLDQVTQALNNIQSNADNLLSATTQYKNSIESDGISQRVLNFH